MCTKGVDLVECGMPQCWGILVSINMLRITPFNVLVQFCAAHLNLPIPLDLPSDEITKAGSEVALTTSTCRPDDQSDIALKELNNDAC